MTAHPWTVKDWVREILRYFFLGCWIAAGVWGYWRVRPRIVAHELKWNEHRLSGALSGVLPEFNNQPWKEKIISRGQVFFPAKNIRAGQPPEMKGFAFIQAVSDGSAQAHLLVGADMTGKMTGARLLGCASGGLPPICSHQTILAESVQQSDLMEATDPHEEAVMRWLREAEIRIRTHLDELVSQTGAGATPHADA